MPLSDAEEKRMLGDLKVIPPLMRQAQQNLTGNARDLWVAGIENIVAQGEILDQMKAELAAENNGEIDAAIDEARAATDELVAWLREQAPSKDGPSGIGKENYEWYQMNVHYVPLTYVEERFLLQRELDRAWSSLRLEEHNNRNLPPARSRQFAGRVRCAVRGVRSEDDGLPRQQEILTIKPYLEPCAARACRRVRSSPKNGTSSGS